MIRKNSPIRFFITLVAVGLLTSVAIKPGLSLASGVLAAPVGSDSYYPLVYGDSPSKAQLLSLGRKIFFDANLSASGKMSCASCHIPEHAYGAANALSVQLGGSDMKQMGFRNTPSLTYLNSPIKFTEHFYEPEVTGGQDDEGATGGRTWDGRVNTGHEQALIPLLDPNEMANENASQVVAKIRKSSYAEEFSQSLSAPNENVFNDPEAVINWAMVAIEMFEQSAIDFYPFTSKYDAYLRDQVALTPKEKRGLLLFNDPKKGNCASCHTSTQKNAASHLPIFTDFGFVATAAPRNKDIAANTNPFFYDLGLCGPLRTEFRDRPEYCGLFRTPSLRNVAIRKSYFHNGVFHSLKEVLDFYVTREINPEKWYAKSNNGKVKKYDDLPEQYHKNINVEAPFAPLKNNQPRLTKTEINDVIAFLGTLTDGYKIPKKPGNQSNIQTSQLH